MTDQEAREAINDKSEVTVGPADLIDPAGTGQNHVLVAKGRLVAFQKRKGKLVFLFQNPLDERTVGSASMFRFN